jgi:exopolysaccharide biosynthesis protein
MSKIFKSLSRGSRGSFVKQAQERLIAHGAKIVADGSFGPATETAVKKFQSEQKLEATGIVDFITWENLNDLPSPSFYMGYRRFGSNVHILALDKKHKLDVDLGAKNKLEKPSTILSNIRKTGKNAIAAINCGFFSWDGKNEHMGLFIDEGLYYNPPSANFIDMEYYKDGNVEVKNLTGYDQKYLSMLQEKCHWAIGTSYALIADGKPVNWNWDKFDHSKSRHPRTLLGWMKDGNFVIVVVDGREGNLNQGVTAEQSRSIMQELGCYHAVNVDGGGSSGLALLENGKIVIKNRPSGKTERPVGSVFVVYE